jgi:hypothetical protein
MKVRKYHSILLMTSVLFMMAHNIMPHQHDRGLDGPRYSTVENQGDFVLLVAQALTSDLGQSHLEYAALQEVRREAGSFAPQDSDCLQIVALLRFGGAGPMCRNDRDVVPVHLCLARRCGLLRAPPAA